METTALVLLALLGGGLLSAQGPILARLASHVGGPVQAAIVAFSIGLCALVAVLIASGSPAPRLSGLVRMPLWVWAGGLIGTGLLVLTLHAVPRIGVTAFVVAVVCGQLLAALAYDHAGAFGMEVRRIGPREIIGVLLLIGGLALIVGRGRA